MNSSDLFCYLVFEMVFRLLMKIMSSFSYFKTKDICLSLITRNFPFNQIVDVSYILYILDTNISNWD